MASLFAKQGYVTLPTADLDEELKQFITLKVEENKTSGN